MAEVTLPQLGETVTEGTITRWFKKVGDNVAADEPLFEVSTDKVDTEVPSPIAGVLLEIRVPEGDTGEGGAVIGGVGDAGAAPAPAPAPAAPVAAPEPAVTLPSVERSGDSAPHGAASSSLGSDIVLSPVVRRLVAEHSLNPS
ncbi:MAG: biotin/lipoyl-containing protein, partial [Ilumatobacteraceae bacterium]